MTETSPGPDAAQRFELRSPLVIRALVMGAFAALLGAALVVLWAAQGWSVIVLVVGLLLLLVGAVLVGAALLAYGRGKQEILLGDGAIVVRARGSERRVAMRDVTEVKVGDAGLRLLLADGEAEPVVVTNPGGRAEASFVLVMRAVQVALEADRGYQPFN